MVSQVIQKVEKENTKSTREEAQVSATDTCSSPAVVASSRLSALELVLPPKTFPALFKHTNELSSPLSGVAMVALITGSDIYHPITI